MVERDRKISTKAKVIRGVSLVAFAAAAAGCEARGLRDEEGNLFPTQPYTTQPTEVPPTSTPFSLVEATPTEVFRHAAERRDFEIKGGIISAEGLLSECKQVLEIEPSLTGMARVEGAMVNLNFPNIRNKITFGLHPSVMDRPPGSDIAEVKRMFLNNEYWDAKAGKGSAERQILTDVMYLHYRAWQYDNNWQLYHERKNVSFFDYLRMLDSAEIDGGHLLQVRVDNSNLLPYKDLVRIYPTDPMVVVFADYGYRGEPYIGGSLGSDFAFDPTTQTFIVVRKSRDSVRLGVLPASPYLYGSMIRMLEFMSNPRGYQRKTSSPPPHEIIVKLKKVYGETFEVIFYSAEAFRGAPLVATEEAP